MMRQERLRAKERGIEVEKRGSEKNKTNQKTNKQAPRHRGT